MNAIKNTNDLESKKLQLKDSIDYMIDGYTDDPVQQEVLLLMKEMADRLKLKNSIQSYYESLEDNYE